MLVFVNLRAVPTAIALITNAVNVSVTGSVTTHLCWTIRNANASAVCTSVMRVTDLTMTVVSASVTGSVNTHMCWTIRNANASAVCTSVMRVTDLTMTVVSASVTGSVSTHMCWTIRNANASAVCTSVMRVTDLTMTVVSASAIKGVHLATNWTETSASVCHNAARVVPVDTTLTARLVNVNVDVASIQLGTGTMQTSAPPSVTMRLSANTPLMATSATGLENAKGLNVASTANGTPAMPPSVALSQPKGSATILRMDGSATGRKAATNIQSKGQSAAGIGHKLHTHK